MPLRMLGIVLSISLLSLGACAEKAARSSAAQRQKVAQWITKTPTAPQHPLDIKFDDKVALVGYDVSGDTLEVGKPLTVTWHWRVDKALGDGWRLFTHVADAADVSRVNLDSAGAIRQNFQPDNWEVGSYIRDPQLIALPKDWDSSKAILYVGFWKGNERLSVTGPKDATKRARALTLPVGAVGGEKQELLEMHVARADQKITLDGKLDEPAWARAVTTQSFVNTMTGASAEPTVTVKTLWDDEQLYVAFEVADDFLKSSFTKNEDHLWEQDAVEIMIDPDADGKNYFELQVSPANKSFDTRYDSRRIPKPFGHMDWSSDLKSGVALRGKLNDDEPDQGYTVEIAIPFKAFAAGEPKHEAPKAADTWRANFYVMDERKDGSRAVGWSAPRVGDFHVPQRFGKLVFDAAAEPVGASEEPKTADKANSANKANKLDGAKSAPKKPAAASPAP